MKRKRFNLFLALCLIFTLLSPMVSYAATKNVNVSNTPPGSSGDITIQGTGVPSDFVNLIDYGTMDFEGSASGSNLYLNKGFTGVTRIMVSVQNKHSSTLTVKLRMKTFLGYDVVDTQTIDPGHTLVYSVDNLGSSKNYYLAFAAPSDFKGYVRSY